MARLVRFFVSCCFLLECNSWQWDVPPTSGYGPLRRGHSLTTFTPTGKPAVVLICGGEDDSQYPSSQCTILDPFSWTYKNAFYLSNSRTDHVALQTGNFLTVASGTANSTGFCDVVDSSTWTLAAGGKCTGALPTATWGSSLVTTSKGVSVVFGGATGSARDPGADTNDVFALDGTAAPVIAWTKPTLTADAPPSARHYHAAASWGTLMVVFGGATLGGSILNDLWLLETDSTQWLWTQAVTANPPQLFGHKAVVVGSNFVVFGGQQRSGAAVWSSAVSNGGTWSFSTPSVDGNAPFPILRAAITLLDADGDSDPDLLVYGGSASTSTSATDSLSVLSDIGKSPSGLMGELPLILGGCAGAFVLLGGLAVCAWRRKNRPAGLAAMLAAMSSTNYDHDHGSTDEDDGQGSEGGSPERTGLIAAAAASAGGTGLKQSLNRELSSGYQAASAVASPPPGRRPSRQYSRQLSGVKPVGSPARSASLYGATVLARSASKAPMSQSSSSSGVDPESLLDGDSEAARQAEQDEEDEAQEEAARATEGRLRF